jgi:hypothetical protein
VDEAWLQPVPGRHKAPVALDSFLVKQEKELIEGILQETCGRVLGPLGTAMSPELERRKKMIARSELGVNLARKEFDPGYTVAAGYFNQGSMSSMYQVRVDIPIRLHAEQKQRPALNEQVDLVAGARRSFEAAGQGLQFHVREAFIAAETASRLRNLYTDTSLRYWPIRPAARISWQY